VSAFGVTELITACHRESRERIRSVLMRERNVYRGRELELSSRHFHDDEHAARPCC